MFPPVWILPVFNDFPSLKIVAFYLSGICVCARSPCVSTREMACRWNIRVSSFDRQILLELLRLLVRHRPRRLHASFQTRKGIGVQSLGQVVKSPASTFLSWVQRLSMEFLTRKMARNIMPSVKRLKIIPPQVDEMKVRSMSIKLT